ncbi:MAG: radical SAM protein [Deltaproteobacteria bacterium]|nr:radical SAM protein [Deltaproteobacteria bacterium]
MKIPSAPQKVTLNVTNRCNLICIYCAVSTTKNHPGDLNLVEWKRLIDELARIKVFNLVISGGEPFLRSDLDEILKRIFQYHFRISINTNGTIINRSAINLLADSNRVDNVQVSLDGPDERTHDRMRGQGSFKKMMEGVVQFMESGIPLSFNVVVHKINQNFLPHMVNLAKRIGVSRISFSPLSPQGGAIAHFDELRLDFEDEKDVEHCLKDLRRDHAGLVGGNMLETFDLMERISHSEPKGESVHEANWITSCGGSVSECAIRPEGGVIPCDRLWDYQVGNVREAPFQSIWLHSKGFERFRERYSKRMNSFEECLGCSFISVCRGGCPAVPYNLGKGIDGWDPFSCYMVYAGQKQGYV